MNDSERVCGARRWLHFAREDLYVAHHLLAADGVPPRPAWLFRCTYFTGMSETLLARELRSLKA